MTCLPARAASMVIRWCTSLGAHTVMRSMSSRASRSSWPTCQAPMPCRSANSRAWASLSDATARTSAPAARRKHSAWMSAMNCDPMMPTPMRSMAGPSGSRTAVSNRFAGAGPRPTPGRTVLRQPLRVIGSYAGPQSHPQADSALPATPSLVAPLLRRGSMACRRCLGLLGIPYGVVQHVAEQTLGHRVAAQVLPDEQCAEHDTSGAQLVD